MEPRNDNQLAHTKPKLLTRIKAHWQPKPIQPPEVDPSLPHLNALQRAVEALRYTFLSFEHWMSPNGKMREYTRLTSIVAFLLLVPAVLVFPIVTLILGEVAGWVTSLALISRSLVMIPLAILATIILCKPIVVVTRALLRK